MTVNTKKIIGDLKDDYFIVFFVFIVVLFAMSNIEALLKLYSISIDLSIVTFYLKLARECCIFLLFIFLYIFGVPNRYLFLNAIFILGILFSAMNSTLYSIAWGLRFFLPLFFLITPYSRFPRVLKQDVLKKILTILLSLHVFMQVIHLIFGNGYFAMIDSLGINARNPGLIFFPAASAFLTLSLFVASFCLESKVKNLELYCLSIFLCSSITGVLTYFALIVLVYKYLTKKQKIVMPIYFCVTFLCLHLARYAMTGASYLNETAGGRAKIFRDSIFHAKFDFSNNRFGEFTNGNAGHFGGMAVDSLYAAILTNLSFFWLILLIGLFSFYLYVQREFFKNPKAQLIGMLFLLTSAGMITTEVTFPFLLLILAKIITVQDAEV